MSDPSDRIVLRSYRLAFELERRIHRIDRFRIPLPYGLPLGALGWGAGALIAVLALRQVPLVGPILGMLPWPVQVVFVPGAAAHALCRTTADGRLVHEALLARLLRRMRSARLVALEPVKKAAPLDGAEWAAVADERTPEPGPAIVAGPAELFVCCRARASIARDGLRLHDVEPAPLSAPRQIVVEAGQRVVIEG